MDWSCPVPQSAAQARSLPQSLLQAGSGIGGIWVGIHNFRPQLHLDQWEAAQRPRGTIDSAPFHSFLCRFPATPPVERLASDIWHRLNAGHPCGPPQTLITRQVGVLMAWRRAGVAVPGGSHCTVHCLQCGFKTTNVYARVYILGGRDPRMESPLDMLSRAASMLKTSEEQREYNVTILHYFACIFPWI